MAATGEAATIGPAVPGLGPPGRPRRTRQAAADGGSMPREARDEPPSRRAEPRNGRNAPILPPDAGAAETAGQDAGQAAFSVPWSIDTTAADAEPRPDRRDMDAEARAERQGTGFSPAPARHTESKPFEVAEKLVLTKQPDDASGLNLATEQYRKLAAGCTRPRANAA